MKIKHAVILTTEEIDTLANVLLEACMKTYATQEEQATAIGIAKANFETLLSRYTQQAFKLGKKLYKAIKEVKEEIPVDVLAVTPTEPTM